MELVDLARALWRRRLLVAVGVLAALALAVKALTKPPPGSSGMAWTRVMIDTPKSQLASAEQAGMDSLIWRAHLLADLMTTQESTGAIARSAEIAAENLRVQEPQLYDSTVPTPLPVTAQKAAAIVVEPYVVTLRYVWNLPVIEVETGAPDRQSAIRLAKAVTATLEAADTPSVAGVQKAVEIDDADAAAAAAAGNGPPPDPGVDPAEKVKAVVQDLEAQPAAEIRSRVVVGRSGRLNGLVMAVALLLVWCVCVPLLPRVHGKSRRRAATPAT